MMIEVPEWAEIGRFIEVKTYDSFHGEDRWFREKIISYGNDGFFHSAGRNYPAYYHKFSDLGKTVRTCEQMYDFDAANYGLVE